MIHNETVKIEKASKENLSEKLVKNLNFSETLDIQRINILLENLKDNLFFYIEYPYIDSHYRDTYYFYYSTKFRNYERNCVRIHIFSEDVTDNIKDDDERYLGYFIVRPLAKHPLGKSFISPAAFKNDSFVCCLCKQSINLVGIKLSVNAFPHVVQDEETHKCAESVIWMLLSYFGTRYGTYNSLLPSDIRKKIGTVLKHRLLPSSGLTLEEITICLNSSNHNCLFYISDSNKNSFASLSFFVMRIYIESGMPFIVAYTDEKDENGHVVLAIGHENSSFNGVFNDFSNKSDKNWHDISEYKKNLVFMDDNFSPYTIDNCEGQIKRYSSEGIQYRIRGFIVPTHRHMHMDALAAYKLVSTIFNDKLAGLASFPDKRWITRLLLTSSKDFKNKILHDSVICDEYRHYLLNLLMPRFIWICEIYDEQFYIPDKTDIQICSGLIIIDVTEISSLNSVIAFFLNEIQYENNGDYLKPVKAIRFEKEAYRHNLKGDWNKWQS